jgi:hypothetical protein
LWVGEDSSLEIERQYHLGVDEGVHTVCWLRSVLTRRGRDEEGERRLVEVE